MWGDFRGRPWSCPVISAPNGEGISWPCHADEGREVIRLLEKHGWVEMRSKGSHRHFKHPEQSSVITAPGNALNDILRKAGLK
jgi:predicted RNA binding protein YcfA (HicA-like mRNA interferase family)